MKVASMNGTDSGSDIPPYRYTAALAADIESRWQDFWEEHGTFRARNPVGVLADPTHPRAGAEKLFVLDMFPYRSGAGLHVGHPLGYIGTDCFGRFQRMVGRNVLHAMGFDAFGLPAEQYAVQTGKYPRLTTEENVSRYRLQMRRLGLGYDGRRSVATTDVPFSGHAAPSVRVSVVIWAADTRRHRPNQPGGRTYTSGSLRRGRS